MRSGVTRIQARKCRPQSPDLIQLKALSDMGFTTRELAGMSVVELYNRAVGVLKRCSPETARCLAARLFGPGAWKHFDFLVRD
jgi:hypothetical protein